MSKESLQKMQESLYATMQHTSFKKDMSSAYRHSDSVQEFQDKLVTNIYNSYVAFHAKGTYNEQDLRAALTEIHMVAGKMYDEVEKVRTNKKDEIGSASLIDKIVEAVKSAFGVGESQKAAVDEITKDGFAERIINARKAQAAQAKDQGMGGKQ